MFKRRSLTFSSSLFLLLLSLLFNNQLFARLALNMLELKMPELKIPDLKMPLDIKIPTPFFLQKKNKIIESADISSIMSKIDRNTLVVFDLDYTLFRPTTYLGTKEWSDYLLNKEIKNNKNHELIVQRNYALWLKAQQFNEIELMDQRIPRILKELKSKALGYLVLTEREGTAFEVTQWQLNKFDIDLIKSPLASFTYQSRFKKPTIYREGILFADYSNNKAEVFMDWLLQAMPQLKKRKPIKRIIYIDESLTNVETMQQVAESLGLDFYGIRYSRADNFRKRFNTKLIEAEKRILMSNHADSDIRLMLEELGSFVEHY